jgi:hypothetical protein
VAKVRERMAVRKHTKHRFMRIGLFARNLNDVEGK